MNDLSKAVVIARGPKLSWSDEIYQLTVLCPGVEKSIKAKLRVRGVGLAGTVLCMSGGRGTGWWGRSIASNWALRELRKHCLDRWGFKTVQIAWARPGWMTGKEGQHLLSCRPAAVIKWVHENLHIGDDFCATGNSAGASQIAESMCQWGLYKILDRVVLTAGPPTARLDLGCSPGSALSYRRKSAKALIDSGYPGTPCSIPTPESLDLLHKNSINIGGEYLFKNTRLRLIFGDRDNSAAVDQGKKFYQLMASAGNIDLQMKTIPYVGHNVHKSRNGALEIVKALTGAG